MRLLIDIVSHGLATQLLPLYGPFSQYTKANSKLKRQHLFGEYLADYDLINYQPGARVAPHCDDRGLIQKCCEYFGPYCVLKLLQTGETQTLCHVSKSGNDCCFSTGALESNPVYGGHIDLPPGTLYFMFNAGAWGGPTHAIHNSTTFKSFEKKSYTLVFRPLIKWICCDKYLFF